ncbi:hypothetical protein LTR05_008148 [Lithohypha guttulata]|uniref:FMN hydroxy acid dehydrogenase domain-containing protein n=1 Tax=Lithohypha guttulata TaxID=1690604 RepID=A0AAN7STW2_9EURO|nr:hypothetical protein LTR05_008148 [Lithohypha guttulata]
MSGGAPLPEPTKEPILSISDLKEAADRKLPSLVREFYNSGSTDQRTIAANSDAFTKYHLRSRVLVNVRGLDTSATALGRKVRFPVGCAPAGIQSMAHEDGELATARAAGRWGVNMGVSSFASYAVEEVVDAGKGVVETTKSGDRGGEVVGSAYAMQLYPMRDRALQERIVKRAEKAGCTAIFLTGDSPVLGVRYNEWRNDFRTPEGIGFPNMERTSKQIRESTHDDGFAKMNDDSAAWTTEIKWLKERTKMKIFVKGVICGEDVRAAIESNADGVIVSNHGGRQLDGVPATIDVLEECAAAAEVALGAKCVYVGRPVLWALAYGGQAGVERMLEVLYEDFRRCMALCGCRTVADINRNCLARMGLDGVLRPLRRESRL